MSAHPYPYPERRVSHDHPTVRSERQPADRLEPRVGETFSYKENPMTKGIIQARLVKISKNGSWHLSSTRGTHEYTLTAKEVREIYIQERSTVKYKELQKVWTKQNKTLLP